MSSLNISLFVRPEYHIESWAGFSSVLLRHEACGFLIFFNVCPHETGDVGGEGGDVVVIV